MGLEVSKSPSVPPQPAGTSPVPQVVTDDSPIRALHQPDGLMTLSAGKGIAAIGLQVAPKTVDPIANRISKAERTVQLSLMSPMPQAVLDALKHAIKRGVRVEVLYADKNAILYHLHQAKREIHLQSTGLLLNPTVREAINEAEMRGVKVHIQNGGDIQHQLMDLLGSGAIARPERPGNDRLSTVPTDVSRSQPVDVIVDP